MPGYVPKVLTDEDSPTPAQKATPHDLESVTITNPTSKDFAHAYDNSLYTVRAGETISFAKKLAFHLSKHLATRMVMEDIKDDEKKKTPNIISQRINYDNPYLRIALYKILKDVNLVQQTIACYPYKGWVGEMEKYRKFVEKSQPKETPEKSEGNKDEK